jgi:His/Glu/Gln/Arg/opine family amino acid ABC transporter permease subunit
MKRWEFLTDPALLSFLLWGLGVTLGVALGAIVVSTVLGTALALLRLAPWAIVRLPALVYVEVVRSLPSFLVIVYVFFAAGRLGLGLSVPVSVILGLSLYAAALTAEIVRAGILSIERGQIEAARALGLGAAQTFITIVAPQAARRMAPALASQFVTLTKSTSYGAVIGLHEFLRRGVIIYSRYFNPVEVLLVVGIVYFALCTGLSSLVARLERSPSPGELTSAPREPTE